LAESSKLVDRRHVLAVRFEDVENQATKSIVQSRIVRDGVVAGFAILKLALNEIPYRIEHRSDVLLARAIVLLCQTIGSVKVSGVDGSACG
jgi:hypothetical protein